MRNEQAFNSGNNNLELKMPNLGLAVPRTAVIGVLLTVALLAFEMFNFDTTRYALRNLLGEVTFAGLQWAGILAIAFCAIDFAGLARLFTPEKGRDEPREVWYLMGAWLLGATMNAVMTWWAVSLTLLNHDFGNEVLSRETLLQSVPIFVAVLVWLTRILFIGAFTVAGEHIFDFGRRGQTARAGTYAQPGRSKLNQALPNRAPVRNKSHINAPGAAQSNDPLPDERPFRQPVTDRGSNSRIRQRPPMPNGGMRRVPMNGVRAKGRNRH